MEVGSVKHSAPEVLQAGERRLARVESLRAIAALGMAVAHGWGFGHAFGPATMETYPARIVFGGGFGVYLFFALSGYLLFWPFARQHFGGGARIDLKRYAFNRAVRILPLYWAVVIILLVLQEGGGTFDQWWRFMALWENFSYETAGTVNGALWSVVVEVHFYLLLPFLAAGLAWLARGRRRRAVLALLALGAASLVVWLVFATFRDRLDRLWIHNLPGSFFFFVPGMLLAFARLELEERRPAWLAGRLGHSGTWLLGSVAVWLLIFYHYPLGPLATVAGFLAVGACVLPLREGALLRVLDWRPLAAVGVVSYSLYVWHTRVQENLLTWEPFPDSPAAVIGLTVPIAVAVAFLSYRAIEAPFLALRRRWSSASAPMATGERQGEIPVAAEAPSRA